MVGGFWINNDGLPLQFGTQKVIPDMAGDYLIYGENREIEAFICLGNTNFGPSGVVQVPALPNGFTGTGAPIAAGIQSMGTLFPLQGVAPVTAADGSGNLILKNPQLYIDQVDLECLIAANAGTGGATGLTGIGLALINPTTGVFAQVTPNAGVQLVGSTVNARMTAGAHYTWYADGTAFGTGTPPTAGSWLGAVPLVTNTITPLPTHAYISALATGGTYTGASGGGLLKLRVRYNWYGTINQ